MFKSIITLALLAMTMGLSPVFALDKLTPIYQTNPPQANLGFDVFEEQMVAIRFSPEETTELGSIQLWLMNNASVYQAHITFTLREDHIRANGDSVPSDIILEEWTMRINSEGDMENEPLKSLLNPILKRNEYYWLVAESNASATHNPVWNTAQPIGQHVALGYYGRLNPMESNKWEVGNSSIPAIHIYSTAD